VTGNVSPVVIADHATVTGLSARIENVYINFSSSVLFDGMHTNTNCCGTVRLLDQIKK